MTNNNKMSQIFINFENYARVIQHKSEATITHYLHDLSTFFKFLLHKKKMAKSIEDADMMKVDEGFIRNVTLQDLYDYLTYSEKKGNSSNTRARRVACIRTFFTYLQVKEKIIQVNPADELENPKVEKREPIYLKLNECEQILDYLDATFNDNSTSSYKYNYYRDKCIFTLLLNTGLRLGELCNIKITDIRNNNLTVIGRGNKQRTIPLNEACLKSVREYLSNRKEEKATEDSKEYLFLSSQQKPIQLRTVEIMVKKAIVNAGVKNGEKYTPHKLRHSAATLMYKHGDVDISELQGILGHENIQTTQIYKHIDDDNLKNAVSKNPLANR